MTLRQLEYVLAVARASSFSQAAVDLHVSQPTLSQQIRVLERELGGPLFNRQPGQVRLTLVGRAFVGDAQAAVASAHRARAVGRRAVQLKPEILTLATVRSLAAATLPGAIKRWHELRPDVPIRLLEFADRGLVAEAVVDGRADLGIGPLPTEWHGSRLELGWEQLVLVMPLNDPLIQSARDLSLQALADRDWVLYEEGHGLADEVARACQAAGFEPRGAVRTAQVDAAARLAAAGVGPALVPVQNVPPDLAHHMRGVDPPLSWRIWAYGTPVEFSPSSTAFTEVLLEAPWQRQREFSSA